MNLILYLVFGIALEWALAAVSGGLNIGIFIIGLSLALIPVFGGAGMTSAEPTCRNCKQAPARENGLCNACNQRNDYLDLFGGGKTFLDN